MAPERKRSARDYEQALRRQELAAGRALVQALPAEGAPGARQLAEARRVLTQALFELRRLGRDLDQVIEGLRSRAGPAGGRSGDGKASQPGRAQPGELSRYESVRDAVEEIAERWEGRRGQLTAELDRRQPRQARPPGRAASQPGKPQARPPRPRAGGKNEGGEVSGRRGAAPARPERPRSRRSRRSPG